MENEATRQNLLEQRLRARRAAAQSVKQLVPDPQQTSLSTSQRRLWIVQKMDPESSVSNRPLGIRLQGKLDTRALEASLTEIVRRHEALRTVFPDDDGQPMQRVLPELAVVLEVRELETLPVIRRETEARRIAAEEAQKPFDLATGPLIRSLLLRLSSEEHVLLLLMHHIVFDGWSENVLLRELQILYEAFRNGRGSPLPELPIQYRDFGALQNQRLQERLEEQLRYWKGQLAGIPPALALPTDHPRKHVSLSRGGKCSIVIGTALSEQLKALSRRENVTLFMTLLSTFQLLLSRCAGQKDILVGIPVAGRTCPEAEGLIGCFMNMLVTRTKLTGDPTFRELLGQVRETALQAFTHQDIPFEKLVEELRPERELNRWPLFQVMFNFRNLPRRPPPQPSDLCLELFPFDRGTIGGLDLSLEIKETDAGLHCTFSYAQELFRADTIERMGGVFRTLLEAIAADVGRPISSYPLLTGEERRQVLIEWNQTRREYPEDRCLHHLFEAQAQRTPESVAVVFEEEQITYQQLNERANQLAHHLRKRGVASETLVGICMERSLELVVGLLGILKAGGAYLPLDPEYPKDRLAYMLNDARTTVVITQQRQVAKLPQTGAWLVCLDTSPNSSSLEEKQRPDSNVTAANLAYVIYTSGSTGRPKGVMISHRSVCNYLYWRREYFPLKESDKLLQKASLSFDDSVWEIFEPLMVGARLVMARPGGHQDSAYLVDLIASQKITAACFVPSSLQAFLEEPGVADCQSLRRVTTGGEALSVELQGCFSERLRADLYNGYGPTEATIGATFWACRRNLLQHSVPIGRPISNTEIYLLDSQLNPVPVGVLGELCIAGAGLARGYLTSPELTAERFVSNPFSQTPGGRLYRTGDLARYLPGGNLEFLGRLDSQVKIRGVRVEPGEVEAVVRQHPSINTAMVLVRDDQNRAKRLVAYLVARPERSLEIPELRRFLMERLPGHMIPTAFVMLDALPLTPGGKVDRQALPAPDWGGLKQQKNFAAPGGPIEEKLTKIWADVLGVRQVGLHDNFFELGGHSLLATRLLSRVYGTFGVEVTLRSLFEKPTIEGLALVIAQRLTERATKIDLNVVLESLESLSDEQARCLTSLKGMSVESLDNGVKDS